MQVGIHGCPYHLSEHCVKQQNNFNVASCGLSRISVLLRDWSILRFVSGCVFFAYFCILFFWASDNRETSLHHVATVSKFLISANCGPAIEKYKETIALTCMAFLCMITLRGKTVARTLFFHRSKRQMSFSLEKDFCDPTNLLPWQCDVTLVLSVSPRLHAWIPLINGSLNGKPSKRSFTAQSFDCDRPKLS